MEASMNSIIRSVTIAAGLILMLNTTPSWGQPVCAPPGCNPTASDAKSNTAGGSNALGNIEGTASNNTAFGESALLNNTTGSFNTATGNNALQLNTTGGGNTATGFNALLINSAGNFNTATGSNTLVNNSTGGENTATGFFALVSNDTGDNNTATGFNALFGNTTGRFNTATGAGALAVNATGVKNTAVGRSALLNSTGSRNIAIGFKAGIQLLGGNNNIYLGNPGAEAESLTMRLGNVQTSTFIAGIATANVSGATVEVDTTTGQLGIVTSSARYKQDIASMGMSSDGVLHLRPVTFSYKEDTQKVKHYGLIAEDVEKIYPELVTRTASGEVQTVKYQELIPMLLNELQRQRQEFQHALQRQQQDSAEVATLRKELAELRALVGPR